MRQGRAVKRGTWDTLAEGGPVIAFSHILCPVDFSETSDRALQHAVALAEWYDARLTVLHVLPTVASALPPVAALGDVAVAIPEPPSPAQARVALASLVDRVAGARPAPDLRVVEGRPHEVIVEQAASLQADLLVVGTHGHGGFHRLLLGSVTEKVIRTASCPVLTVPPAQTGASPHVVFRQILCPTDFSPTSQRATQLALDLGRQSGGCVTLLHAIEYLEPEEPCEHVAFDIRDYRARLLEHFRQRLHAQVADDARTWCEVQEVLAINRAYREILDRAAALPADLIVMGAQGHGGLELMLYGSNTQQVVRRATCPVLTVRA